MGIAEGADQFIETQSLLDSLLGRLLLFLFSFALFFHFTHGIRHLFWDMGKTFERDEMDRFAVIEILAAASLALLVWIIRLII